MLPEIQNTKIQYPFLQLSPSDLTAKSFAESIKDIRIFFYSDQPVQAFVTEFSSSGITCQLTKTRSLATTVIQISSTGIFQGENIDRRNSFIQFSSPVTVQGTGRLRLLPQTVVCIPTELKLSISSRGIKAKAQIGQPQTSDSEIIADVLVQPHFISGYNFIPFIDQQSGAVIFSAGSGMGVDKTSVSYIRHRIADCTSDSYHSDSYYYGLRTINGQADQILLEVSASMYMKTTLSNDTLNLVIQRPQKNVQTP